MSEPEKIMGLMPNFSSFYATWSNRLLEIYAVAGTVEFWRMLKMFIRTLPRDIKADVWPEVVKADSELNLRLTRIRGSDIYTTTQRQVFDQETYLEKLATEIYDKTQDLLDLHGYKERESHRIRLKDFEELDTIESKMDQGQ